MRKFWTYLKGWRGIVLISYMWLILMGWAIMHVDMTSPAMKKKFYAVCVAEALLVIAGLVCPRLLRWAEGLTMHHDFGELSADERRRFFLKTWLYIFLAFLAMYIVFYPGGLGVDNVAQYGQSLSGNYHDHHPVFHTLFSFTLPLSLTGGWFGSINLFQLIIFSFSLAYMAYTLYEYGSYLFAKRFLLFIMLNPITLCYSIMPLKDVAFAIASMLMMTFAVRIHFTDGQWLKSLRNIVIFVLVAVSGTLFRHNAILFTLPLFLSVSLYISKKKAIAMLLCWAGLIYAVRYPLYDALKVDRSANNRQIEACGLCMTIIGNAVKEAPERLDDEILEFAYTIAPKAIWEKQFDVFIGWDDIKMKRFRYNPDSDDVARMDVQAVERVGWRKIVIMTLRCFKEAPYESLRGALGITAVNYGIAGGVTNLDIPVVASNYFGVSSNNFFRMNFLSGLVMKLIPSNIRGLQDFRKGDISLQSVLIIVIMGLIVLFRHIFWHVGVINLVVIVFILARLKFNRAYDWKRLCLVLPLLMHNFGTMLLLMNSIFRYFYVSYLVLPLVILVLMCGKESS